MILKVLAGIVVLVGLFLGYVAFQPADYKITREISIQATPETLFPYINNSKLGDSWMPWKDSDPNMQMQYSGPEEGVGSTSMWVSNGQMGTGKAEVVESVPNQVVKTKLTSEKPFPMEQMAEMLLTPNGDSTVLRWSVEGKNNFVGRIFCVFFNMDKMVGGEFEKGLATLKTMIEKPK